ncbi:hypothetical protein DID88_004139 [Monilinia fructigena]|uniref:Uncharacterized protein n=1 Tax=Monilinia fructigena TaxID=38457 RepID=A0A395IT71_9HELO|nr:hypothetical protein DID88_004139 [Monilinia fructigena]
MIYLLETPPTLVLRPPQVLRKNGSVGPGTAVQNGPAELDDFGLPLKRVVIQEPVTYEGVESAESEDKSNVLEDRDIENAENGTKNADVAKGKFRDDK